MNRLLCYVIFDQTMLRIRREKVIGPLDSKAFEDVRFQNLRPCEVNHVCGRRFGSIQTACWANSTATRTGRDGLSMS